MLFMAAKVALVVGSVLLVINQYDALFADANLKVLPAILTYCVPFCVFLAGQKIKV
ncbi:nitrate/nitrite transporter NrtS [Pseudoalteromonas sp. SWXJZ94C]|nr:nitrate/nitrite transporter NrtS [Pseudoalteromonas sp. SWXJZ94C]